MSPWIELNEKNVSEVPSGILGIYQLARGEPNIAYVGRSDADLKTALQGYFGKGYTHFQWVQVPWVKEGFEMHCRLYHLGGGRTRLDNEDHPYPPEGKFWQCTLSSLSPSTCNL